MSDELFLTALRFFWRPENDGQAYHNTRGDAGGATAWGATFNTYIAWRTMHGIHGPGGTLAEFAALQQADFQQFYRAGFWNPIQGDQLPAGVGLVVFDAAAMSGVERAARWLQRVVGTTQDGAIGPHTLAAVTALDPADVITRFTSVRRSFYDTIVAENPDQGKFINGWMRRAGDCAAAAAALIPDA